MNPTPCPHCGYCPTCGKPPGAYPYWSVIPPYTYPYYRYAPFYGTVTVSNTAQDLILNTT